MRNGATSLNFHIAHSSVGNKIVPWVDLNKTFFHHFLIAGTGTDNYDGYVKFRQYCGLRRSYAAFGQALRGSTTVQYYGLGSAVNNVVEIPVSHYGGVGIGTNTPTSNTVFGSPPFSSNQFAAPIFLPIHTTTNNSAYTTDQIPIFTGMLYSNYLQKALPSDFGITFHYANNTMTLQDTFVVSSGSEEWEMIALTNNATITTGASPLFVARTV